MAMEGLDIVIMGVGGQGTLLASKVLGHLAQAMGRDVKVSEVHGMSQRGGSVTTYVRIAAEGKKVAAPLVEQQGADYVLAFEELEALRALPYLKAGGTIILNTQRIMPLPVIIKAAQYPENIVQRLRQEAGGQVLAIDALPLARAAGNERAVNTLLLGALSARLDIDRRLWLDALEANVPPQFIQANLKAFDIGAGL
jgi:indolepyruvate ferredoxin oxidoreductase beta subunit